MRRAFVWIELVLAALVVVGVFVQVYLITAYILGGNTDALSAHQDVGGIVHGLEVLVLLAALVAFWRIRWGWIGHAAALPIIGTVQIAFAESDGNEWVGALHGALALVVVAIAAGIVSMNLRYLRATDPAASASPPG